MMRRRTGVSVALLALLLVCFARLAADPSALIVDADHPSVDHARHVDDASAGNDVTRLFLPHHLAIARLDRPSGTLPLWDDRGFGGRPLVGNPQAGLFYPPTWLAWWSGRPRLSAGSPSPTYSGPAWEPIAWRRRRGWVGGEAWSRRDASRHRLTSWPRRSRGIIPMSGRSAGIPGRSRRPFDSVGASSRRSGPHADPGRHVSGRSSSGGVLPPDRTGGMGGLGWLVALRAGPTPRRGTVRDGLGGGSGPGGRSDRRRTGARRDGSGVGLEVVPAADSPGEPLPSGPAQRAPDPGPLRAGGSVELFRARKYWESVRRSGWCPCSWPWWP